MIRREQHNADGTTDWILLTQREHARVSGELAKHWGNEPFLPLRPADVVLPAIYRHDDGWRQWEAAPQVDPVSGKPRSFTEMPVDDAHQIWARSIDDVADLGPLAQFMIAEHFIFLRSHGDDAALPESQRFLDTYRRKCRTWLGQWQSANPALHTEEIARRAVEHLQLFDALSLWLCCAPRSQSWSILAPGGTELQLTPQSEHEVSLRPWPLTIPRLKIEAAGKRLAPGKFATDQQLHTALAVAAETVLSWHLVPAA